MERGCWCERARGYWILVQLRHTVQYPAKVFQCNMSRLNITQQFSYGGLEHCLQLFIFSAGHYVMEFSATAPNSTLWSPQKQLKHWSCIDNGRTCMHKYMNHELQFQWICMSPNHNRSPFLVSFRWQLQTSNLITFAFIFSVFVAAAVPKKNF